MRDRGVRTELRKPSNGDKYIHPLFSQICVRTIKGCVVRCEELDSKMMIDDSQLRKKIFSYVNKTGIWSQKNLNVSQLHISITGAIIKALPQQQYHTLTIKRMHHAHLQVYICILRLYWFIFYLFTVKINSFNLHWPCMQLLSLFKGPVLMSPLCSQRSCPTAEGHTRGFTYSTHSENRNVVGKSSPPEDIFGIYYWPYY